MNKKSLACLSATVLLSMIAVNLTSCKKSDVVDNEKTRLILSTQELDGVFNPFYSTSGTDGNIVSMTQISMLNSDKNGDVAYGKNEACVVLDYDTIERGQGDDKTTTYQFVLKKDIKFSDGSPLTMKDVLFNLYEYLDPNYYGSATLYSTDIVGLQEYRTQQSTEEGQKAFSQRFLDDASDRVQNLLDDAETVFEDNKGTTLSLAQFKIKLSDEANLYSGHENVVSDFEKACSLFKEELENDYTNSMSTYDSIKYTDKSGKEVALKNDTEAFLFNEGFISWDKKAYQYEYSFGAASSNWDKQTAIDTVFNTLMPKNIGLVLTGYQTATNLKEYLANLAKEEYFKNTKREYKNISGIKFANKGNPISVNGKTYSAPTYAEDGSVSNDTNEVLEITIKGVDPKAIWNFGFTVAPMFYYSSEEEIAKFDYTENFGVEYSSQTFQDRVIKKQSKLGLPVGAGAYKATNKFGDSENINSTDFFSNNVVYFERNDNFVLGKPKIKYVNYQVIPSKQLMSALYAKQVHFVEPTCKQEIIDDINAHKSKGFNSNYVMTNGYGYIGINASKVPDVEVRRAIMHAINTQLCLDYYPGYSSPIYRPMTKASWAYPDGLTEQYYKYDPTGEICEKLVKEAGYTKNARGVYSKNGNTLKYTFTIAGDSTDHPAYLAMKQASEILNAHGFDISVYPDLNALKKLNEGSLTCWAAAWGSSVDPDMYQVYHMESTATSTSNWGYKAILNNREKYAYEYQVITELSELIDKGRETLDKAQRKTIYGEALDKIMDLAVELPTYQRSDLYAYNTNVIDENSMTPKNDITSYNGPLAKLWEVSLKETK